ncbi:MAG: hypothetical protein AB8F78_02740 [Saprospiraceae bacterium]
MRVLLLFCLISLFGTTQLEAQTLTKNSDGEQIIVYPDGSWRYFKQTPPGEAPASTPTPPQEEQYSNQKFDAEAEARARAVLRKQIQTELKQAKGLEKTAEKLVKKEKKEEERVATLRSSSASKDREQVSVANRKLQDARQIANQANLDVEAAQKRITLLEQALPMTRSSRKTFLTQAGILEEDFFASDPENIDVVAENPDGSTPTPALVLESSAPSKLKQQEYTPYSLKNDPRYNPPKQDCSYSYNGVDEFTQKKRMNLTPRLFFGHTNPELKPYLGDESLVTCTGNLSKSGGYLILELDFVIRSQYANKEFGVLPKGSQLTLKLLNNEKVTLRNQMLSQGKFDPVEKIFSYKARYTISNKQEKLLERKLVDQVRVMWGTGFDDYTVYEVDFFQQQLRCL